MSRASDYDYFWAARDTGVAEAVVASTSPSANFTLTPDTLTVAVSSSANFAAGALVTITEASKPIAHARVVGVPSGASLRLRPIRSTADGAGAVGTTYTTSATIAAAHAQLLTLVIDLSDAPAGAYKYLLLADAAFGSPTAGLRAAAHLRHSCLLGDPFSGTIVQQARETIANTNSVRQWIPYNAACSVSLQAGQRYEFHLEVAVAAGSAGQKAQMRRGHIYAQRVGFIIEVGDGTGAGLTTTGTSDASDASHTISLPAGDSLTLQNYWLVVGCRVINNSTASALTRTKVTGPAFFDQDDIQDISSTIANASDDRSVGFACIIRSSDAGGDLKLTLSATGGGTARMRYGYLAAIPLSGYYGQAFSADQEWNGWEVAAVSTDTYGDAGSYSTPVSTPGWFLQIFQAQASKGGNAQWGARPFWGGEDLEAGHRRQEIACEYRHGWFWLMRSQRKGVTQHKLQLRSTSGTGTNVNSEAKLAAIREQSPRDQAESDENTLVLELEAPIAYRNFTSVSGTLYKREILDADQIGRVTVNGVALSEVPDRPTSGGTWHFNPERAGLGAIDTTISGVHLQPSEEEDVNAVTVTITVAAGTNFAAGRRVAITGGGRTYHARVLSGSGTSWTIASLLEDGDSLPGTSYPDGSTVKAIEGKYLYVQLASGSPADADKLVVVAELLRFSRRGETVRDEHGRDVPTDSRLLAVPTVNEVGDARLDSGYRITRSRGDAVLANPDGGLDRLTSRRVLDGGRVSLYRGSKDVSRDLRTFERLLGGRVGMPEWPPEKISVPIFDRTSTLGRRLSLISFAAYQGTAGQIAYGQEPDVIYGPAKRVAAFRLTNNTGGSDDNYFKVAASALLALDAAYKDPTTLQTITATLHDAARAIVKVNNAQTSNVPQDLIYVDVRGIAVSGALLQAPGEILEHFLQNFPQSAAGTAGASTTTSGSHTPQPGTATAVTVGAAPPIGARVKVTSGSNSYWAQVVSSTPHLLPLRESTDVLGVAYGSGATVQEFSPGSLGLQTTDLVRPSFRLLDRLWRRTIAAGAPVSKPIFMAFVFKAQQRIRECLETIGRHVFVAIRATVQDRLEVVPPDFDARQALFNGGFEENSNDLWPWRSESATTLLVAGYSGARGAVVANLRNNQARIVQEALLPTPGLWAVTALVKLSGGMSDSVALSVVPPGDGLRETIGDPVIALSSAWRRAYAIVNLPRGAAGTASIAAYPTRRRVAPPPSNGLAYWYDFGFDTQFPEDYATWSPITNRGSAGSAGNLAQSSAGKYPLPKDNVIGFRRAARFDGTNDAWALAAAPSIGNLGQAHTLWVVFKMAAVSGTQYLFGYDTGNYLRYNAASTRFEYADAGGAQVTWTKALSAGAWYAACARRNNNGTVTLYLYDGGTLSSSGSLSVWNGALTWSTLGAIDGAGGSPFNGDIAEALIYTTYQSDKEFDLTLGYLKASFGLDDATVLFDNVECYPIAAVLEESNFAPGTGSFASEIASACSATYQYNNSDQSIIPKARLVGNEARGIAPLDFTEAEQVLEAATVVEIPDSQFADADSARAVAAQYVRRFDQLRQVLPGTAHKLERMPRVGDLVYLDHPRVPDTADSYRLWLVQEVRLDPENPREAELVLERQIDYQADRTG